MTKCDACGEELDKIQYIYPTTHPKGQVNEAVGGRRPPLCKPCWTEIVEEGASRS